MEQQTTFGLGQIEQIALPVKDVDRAVAFYRDKLGMQYMFSSNGLAFFNCGGVRLLLSRPEGVDDSHSSVIYFKVPDIFQAHKVMVERGVSFDDEPHKIADMDGYELWMAFFRDSENNVLAISGEVR